MEWFIFSLPAHCGAFRWPQEYAPSVSERFRGFREMVSSNNRIDFTVKLAGRAYSAVIGLGAATPGRKTIMKSMKLTRRGLLGTASALTATAILGRPAQAAAEFDFKLGANTPE